MKVYLASFFEKQNHGTGRLFSIAQFYPAEMKIDGEIKCLAPSSGNRQEFKKNGKSIPARLTFAERYRDELNEEEVLKAIKTLQEGDTLCCWEHTKPNYFCHRQIAAEILAQENIEVILDGVPLDQLR